MTSPWTARYADLTGKAVIVAGESSYIVEIVRGLAANAALLAIVAPDRDVVDEAVQVAESLDATVVGMTADLSTAEVWERIAPHVEQRLGPIDVAVIIATEPTRRVITGVLLPDMAARKRGVLIEAGAKVAPLTTPAGVRHRGIEGELTAAEVAAAVLFCASDTMATPSLILTGA